MMQGRIFNNQRGIALIQVLIISIILTMLGIFISQTVREQVQITKTIQSSHNALAILETVEAELIHSLTTNRRYKNSKSESIYVRSWNFHNEPFKISEKVQISLQDLSGLLSINYMNSMFARRLFKELGHEEAVTRVFFDSLKDWKDKDDLKRLNGAEREFYVKNDKQGPRNGYLQMMSELQNIRGSDFFTHKQWDEYFSLALLTRFNPLNAPDILLKAFLNNERVWQQVMELRNSNQLNMMNFIKATGIDENESITFITGRLIKVVITVKTENGEMKKSFNVELKPNSINRPVIISEVKWNE